MLLSFKLVVIALSCCTCALVNAIPSPAPSPMESNSGDGNWDHYSPSKLHKIKTGHTRKLKEKADPGSLTSRFNVAISPPRLGSQTSRADYENYSDRRTGSKSHRFSENSRRKSKEKASNVDEGLRHSSGRFYRQRSKLPYQNLDESENDDEEDGNNYQGRTKRNPSDGSLTFERSNQGPVIPQWESRGPRSFGTIEPNEGYPHVHPDSLAAQEMTTPQYYGSEPYTHSHYAQNPYSYGYGYTDTSGYPLEFRETPQTHMIGSNIGYGSSSQYHDRDMDHLSDHAQAIWIGEGNSPARIEGENYAAEEDENDEEEGHSDEYNNEEEDESFQVSGRRGKGIRDRRKKRLERKDQFPDRPRAIPRPRLPITMAQKEANLASYFTSLVSKLQQEHTSSELVLGKDFTAPWEYQLPIGTEIVYEPGKSYVNGYDVLSKDQALVLADRIRRVRAYSGHVIQQKIVDFLQDHQARDILFGTPRERKAAIESIFPDEADRRKLRYKPWMHGLSEDNRIKVVNVLSDATGEPADRLHEAMLTETFTHNDAMDVLDSSRARHLELAYRRELYSMRERHWAKWNKGLTVLQRSALIQRICNTGVTEGRARKLLTAPYVPEGLGKVLLRASSSEFIEIMSYWRNVQFPPGYEY
jgi:hypothetical protein